jgi:eukaryotic-like serine/threonine-protein kinase
LQHVSPFAAATAREVLEQERSPDLAPPSTLNREVPPLPEWVCLGCLRTNPWRRFKRAYDLLAKLRTVREDLEGRTGKGQGRARRRAE